MRRRRIIAVLAIIVCAVAVALMLLARPQPPPLSITVLRYEKELAGHITAHLVVTNTGPDVIYFLRGRSEIALLTQDGWITNRPGAFTMMPAGELKPGAHSLEQVVLVSGVGAWKIGYEARTPSPRATLFNRLPPKLRTRAFAIEALRNWISEEEAAPQKVWSRMFDAQEWFDARAELEYLNAPLHKIFPASKSAAAPTNLVRARFTLPPLTANAPR